ncbi:importin subunit beta-3-like isoform X1 [Prosopis cineraria]|uniref:importin subunit beta-3-like isoform X1 n=1 Tax=Prosopis cineraria TaxID=364024 RepID=UPI00240EFB1C|nr:importin subunit beta-3-like isoform X1 [Prosopis cineraria]
MLDEQALRRVSEFLVELSAEARCSIFQNCVRLLLCIADVPAWYDVESTSSGYMGISEKYRLGKFLLFRVCWHSPEDIPLSIGFEMVPQYLISENWQVRHAGLIVFAATVSACGRPEMICDHAERVLEISLTDAHPRVLWAAIDAIICLTSDSDQKHVRYLNKFVPRLVAIIRSASIYPRLQLHAVIVTGRLIKYCGDEEVKSFSEDLVPELLKFLKFYANNHLQRGGKFREEATETLRPLAVSFSVVLRKYYQETVDSLKPLISQLLLGAKSIESLSYIFSAFLWDHSALSLLKNAGEVFLVVFRIANNWTDTDRRLKIHILKALSQLCRLPRLEADKFLNEIMPLLIPTLEDIDPYMFGFKYSLQL